MMTFALFLSHSTVLCIGFVLGMVWASIDWLKTDESEADLSPDGNP